MPTCCFTVVRARPDMCARAHTHKHFLLHYGQIRGTFHYVYIYISTYAQTKVLIRPESNVSFTLTG